MWTGSFLHYPFPPTVLKGQQLCPRVKVENTFSSQTKPNNWTEKGIGELELRYWFVYFRTLFHLRILNVFKWCSIILLHCPIILLDTQMHFVFWLSHTENHKSISKYHFLVARCRWSWLEVVERKEKDVISETTGWSSVIIYSWLLDWWWKLIPDNDVPMTGGIFMVVVSLSLVLSLCDCGDNNEENCYEVLYFCFFKTKLRRFSFSSWHVPNFNFSYGWLFSWWN